MRIDNITLKHLAFYTLLHVITITQGMISYPEFQNFQSRNLLEDDETICFSKTPTNAYP